MASTESTDTTGLIQSLRQEVARLSEIQSKALEDAVYVGMTPEQAQEYDQRRKTITQIISRLMMLEQSR